jgi:large subunit ribosomal protein L4e
MSKLNVLGIDGKSQGNVELPKQFIEPVRLDLIQRAVLSLQSRARQPYGADPQAGRRHSVDVSRRRRDYRGSYGKGISRVPRKVLSRRGGQFSWVGAFAPGTVGGRRAHPPKSEKIWTRKINTKENRKAIRAALAATLDTSLVSARGHRAPTNYPFALVDGIEQIAKTKELIATLETLGFTEELARAADIQTRSSGIARMRGRARKVRVSVLIVASADAPVMTAAQNIPGVQAVAVNELNAELLAPGAHPGRLTLFTQGALKRMEEANLFA